MNRLTGMFFVVLTITLFMAVEGNLMSMPKINPIKTKVPEQVVVGTTLFNSNDLVSMLVKTQNGIRKKPSNDSDSDADSREVPLDDDLDYETYLGKTYTPFIPAGLETTLDETKADYWSYKEQNRWPTIAAACSGTKQSPIALSNQIAASTSALPCLRWANYHSFHKYLSFNNNGHTIEAKSTGETGSQPILSGGPLNGTYAFGSLHWHWGEDKYRGSEHTWEGRALPIEAHFVHYSTKFANLSAAASSGEDGALAVVGIGIKVSLFATSGMSIITKAMRRAQGPGEQSTVLPLGDLGLNFRDDYYTYSGSLTTPPCTEGVVWIVSNNYIKIRESQLKVFRNLYVNGRPLVNNYRSIQAKNGRLVRFAKTC